MNNPKIFIIDCNSSKDYGSRKATRIGTKYDYTYYRIISKVYILLCRKKGTHYYETKSKEN